MDRARVELRLPTENEQGYLSIRGGYYRSDCLQAYCQYEGVGETGSAQDYERFTLVCRSPIAAPHPANGRDIEEALFPIPLLR